jgi:YfiH family protein
VGDDAAAVAENRARFTAALGAQPVWLQQVHGARVVHLRADAADSSLPAADAAWTRDPGLACAVLVADCLPVLMALRDGRAVAAAHAGWRGLAAGVLEATVQALCAGAGASAGDIVAWLGPCIGPRRFEVGADVLQACGALASPATAACFDYRPRPDGSPRWLADLPRLARQRLQGAGVELVSEAGACTVEDASSFFSFRRDGVTGRHAAAIRRG